MPVKIRLARAGAKKRPFYRIVASDIRKPRDGRFIERLGTYDPLLPRDDPKRVVMNIERIKYWLDHGAQPTDRVALFLGSAEVIPMPKHHNPKKGTPKGKAKEREKAKAEAASAAEAAPAKTVEAAPAEVAEATDDKPAEAAPAEAAPAEAAPAEAQEGGEDSQESSA